MSAPEPTPAQAYSDAVWESTRLTPNQRLAALCFANHARGDTAWVVTARLMARTGIRSRSTACSVVKALVAAGWLTRLGAHPGHSQRVVYRLTVPDEAQVPEPDKPARTRGHNGRYSSAETGPQHEPVQAMDRSTTRTRTGPQHGHEPVHAMDETGPPRGTDSLRLSEDSLSDSQHASPVRPFDAVGATPEEEKIIKARITTGRQIRDLGAYLAAMHRSGDLAAMLDEIRAAARAETVAVALERLRQAPPCRHDCPGGDQLHPGTGELLCPLCRRFGPRDNDAPAAELPQPTTCPEHPPLPGGVDAEGLPHCAVCRGLDTPRDVPVWWKDPPVGQQRQASPLASVVGGAVASQAGTHRRAALTVIQGGQS